jgi:hypothetical protein
MHDGSRQDVTCNIFISLSDHGDVAQIAERSRCRGIKTRISPFFTHPEALVETEEINLCTSYRVLYTEESNL